MNNGTVQAVKDHGSKIGAPAAGNAAAYFLIMWLAQDHPWVAENPTEAVAFGGTLLAYGLFKVNSAFKTVGGVLESVVKKWF